MKKRKITTLIVCISVVIALVIGAISLNNALKPKTYSTAKNICGKILEKNEAQMTEIAVNALKQQDDVSGDYKEYSYHSDKQEQTVKFCIDGQGMLGGQSWDLVYSEKGTLYGENEEYIFKENAQGNNIIKAEKINEHWWYLWTDYDGTERSYS